MNNGVVSLKIKAPLSCMLVAGAWNNITCNANVLVLDVNCGYICYSAPCFDWGKNVI